MTTMNNTTWHDISDQLTAKQVELLSHGEVQPYAEAANLLAVARDYASRNLAAVVIFADVPVPAGAATVGTPDVDDDGGWSRYFTGATRTGRGGSVTIEGVQLAEGGITRSLYVTATDSDLMDAAGARDLAALLLAAADELDSYGGVR